MHFLTFKVTLSEDKSNYTHSHPLHTHTHSERGSLLHINCIILTTSGRSARFSWPLVWLWEASRPQGQLAWARRKVDGQTAPSVLTNQTPPIHFHCGLLSDAWTGCFYFLLHRVCQETCYHLGVLCHLYRTYLFGCQPKAQNSLWYPSMCWRAPSL